MSRNPELPPINSLIVTDPGIDDAVAILASIALARSGSFPAFVATYGNAQIEQTFGNLQYLLNFMTEHSRSDSPAFGAFAGVGQLNLEAKYGSSLEFIHGLRAMEGLGPTPTEVSADARSQNLYEYLAYDKPNKLDILSFGALTELPRILSTPNLSYWTNSITIMGGAFKESGNVEPNLEGNTRHDPWALKKTVEIANDYGISINIVPLDITQHPLLEFAPERIATLLRSLKERGSIHIAQLIESLTGERATYFKHYTLNTRDRLSQTRPYAPRTFRGPAMHDLVALMYVLHPELFLTVKDAAVKVALNGDQAGSIGFAQQHMKPDGVVNVVMDLADGERSADLFWQYVADILASNYT